MSWSLDFPMAPRAGELVAHFLQPLGVVTPLSISSASVTCFSHGPRGSSGSIMQNGFVVDEIATRSCWLCWFPVSFVVS